MKIMIQTMSTKCQYRPAISTYSGCSVVQTARPGDGRQGQQPEDADRHVGAVEAGQREERRAEQVGAERQALVIERRELVELAAEEDRPSSAVAISQIRRRRSSPAGSPPAPAPSSD